MSRSTYLIVGGGMTAAAAVRGIREIDTTGTITVIGADIDPPYRRPWLSKQLWKGKELEKVFLKAEFPGTTFLTSRTVVAIDANAISATDDQGVVHTGEKMLIATGAMPRTLPGSFDNVIAYRSLDDYRHLRTLADQGLTFAVVGGGFVGSEIAAALRMQGNDVSMLFPGATIGDRVFPADLGESLNAMFREKGIDVRTGESVLGVTEHGGQLRVAVSGGDRATLDVGAVVVGIGVVPNVDLAKDAGIKVDNGIEVDKYLQTSAPKIYAAGDVAKVWQDELGEWRRVEHEDNANAMGKHAGKTMAGQATPWDYLPMFYSDLFDVGYEAVGVIDAHLDVVEDWSTPMQTGVIYYLHDDKVRGVLAMNVWDQVDRARDLITSGKRFSILSATERIPNGN